MILAHFPGSCYTSKRNCMIMQHFAAAKAACISIMLHKRHQLQTVYIACHLAICLCFFEQ